MYPVGISAGDAAPCASFSAAQPDYQRAFRSGAGYRGAGAAVSVAQILRELDGGGSAEVPDDDQKPAGRKGAAPDGKKPAQSEGAPASLRSPFRRAVWEALDTTPESLDAVLLKLREGGWEASAPAVMEELVFLELDGLAGASGGQYYRKLSENFCLQ